MLTLETIMLDSIWVAKMQGWRQSGTLEQIGNLANDPDCRDFDLCAKQPDHLREFYDAYWQYNEDHGFTTIQEYYPIWARTQKRLTKWNGKKYTLPQGRTADGESYWRLIAERLAAYENTGLEPEECFPASTGRASGTWEIRSKNCCKCSVCGSGFWHSVKDWIPDNYCPNCGAAMRYEKP